MDGTWEGNLFQFYVRVLPRIAGTLKSPFQLDQQLYRNDESSVGVAVREAIVNSIIHADYSGQGGVVIDRFPNRIELGNPGTLLISHEQLLRGGISECRNKSLQQMFQYMGAGDKAGSGIDTIRRSWDTARLRAPSIRETSQPDRVRLDLPLESILPDDAVQSLSARFGVRLSDLSAEEVQILVMAREDGSITNAKLQEVLTMHRADLTATLQNLVRCGFLERKGFGRWTTYEVTSAAAGDGGLASEGAAPDGSSDGRNDGSSDGRNDGSSDGTEVVGVSDPPEHERVPSLADSDPELWARLSEMGAAARSRRWMSTGELTAMIERMCSLGEWLGIHELGELLGRSATNLRDRTLATMVAEGRLIMRYPAKNHRQQAYSAPGSAMPEQS